MHINHDIKLKGKLTLKMFDSNKKLIDESTYDNLVVSVGKDFLATWLSASSQSNAFMLNVGLGTGTTPADEADTDLETALPTRIASTPTTNGNIFIRTATFLAGVNTGAITEAALFSAISGGTMFSHLVFPEKVKEAGNELLVIWQVTIT